MTGRIDDDTWLRNIGAVSAHDDEDGQDAVPNGSPSTALAADAIAEEGPAMSEDDDVDYGGRGGGDDGFDDPGRSALLGAPVRAADVVVDLDAATTRATKSGDARPRRFNPWVLTAVVTAAIVGTAVTLATTIVNTPSTEPATSASAPVAPRTVKVAPPSPPPNVDGPLTFTASSDCPPGSTAAQSVADPNSTTPWVCVRTVDGQVLSIDLGRTFVITAVSIVPGAVVRTDTNPNQPDPWLQHRVVTRLQWQFNDTDRTVKNQNTGNVRGEAVEAIRPGVAASRITVIIQETSRPPAIAPAPERASGPPSPAGSSSILGDILGGASNAPAAPVPVMPGTADSRRDPADGTFAVGAIKIIGHKAV